MRAAAAYVLFFAHLIQATTGSGYFEVQILSLTNNRGTLVDGRCCGGGSGFDRSIKGDFPPCSESCTTAFWLCLKEYQSNVTAIGSCSFGNVSSHALGQNTFTLNDPVTLQLHFTFRWTRQFTLILQARDEPTAGVIEEASYSGIVLPGPTWHTLNHQGRNAHLAYRVRVQCADHYYNATCTKFCRPRDDIFGHYTCDENGDKVCIQGWKGADCETAVCKEGCHPIHGHCNVSGECKCRHGWRGELCDQCTPYPGCKHGYCNGSSWQCICDTNWGGILCDQDLNYCGTHEPCQNGGTCENTAPDQYRCTCPDGFSGPTCEKVDNPCASNPCLNGATCREIGETANCECAPGFSGPYCATDMDECASQPCQNGGTCADGKNEFSCHCPGAWQGTLCQFDVDECGLKESPCKNSITCVNLAGDYRCRCRSGFTGKNCTKNINDCVGQCQHGALCIDLVNDYHCSCTPGYSGKDCDVDIDECATKPCQNGGECRDLVNAYECVCPVGYTGRQCEIDRDHCSPNPCRNTAPCFNTQTDFYCHCPEQWQGKNCSEPASHNPQFGLGDESLGCGNEGAPCGGRGRCNGGRCICDPGYTGQHCHENINDCRENPCLNGGTCVDLVNSFQCICREGWSGDLCDQDVNECETSPCRNNGTCIDGVADFTCDCRGGWKGKTCTLRGGHCEPGTCRHGGTCQDRGDSFTCHCPSGWEGAACHIASPACASSPCENGATCVNTADRYRCVCREGFEGPNCRRDVDDCQPLPCLNGGRCVDGVNWFRCECAPGFTGPDCRINVNECASDPCMGGATCVDGIASYSCVCPPGRTGTHCEIRTAGGVGCISATWDDDCNLCECRNGKNQCSNVWCGQGNCLNGTSCLAHEVCVPSPGESCLAPSCPAWGECRPIETGRRVGPPALPAPPSCWPGQATTGPTCSRLTILLRRDTLATGTSVELLCRRLRRLLADPRRPQSVVLLCDLKTGDNDTIEVTIFSEAAADAARDLGEALSRPLTRPLALASVLEVKVETALLSDPNSGGSGNGGSGYVAVLGGALAAILLLALVGGLWYLRMRQRSGLTATTSSETSLHRHRSDLDEKSNNLQNEENLRRYANPLKDQDTGEPRVSVVRPLSGIPLSGLGTGEESLEMVSEEGRHRLPPLYKPTSAEARNNTASFSYEEGLHKPYSKPRLQEPSYSHQQPGTSQQASEFIFTGHVGDDGNEEWGGNSEEEEEEEEEYLCEEILTQRGESIDSSRKSERERFSSLPTYAAQSQYKRQGEATALENVKKEQFRKLLGVDFDKGDGESIKTVLTEEEVAEQESEEEGEEKTSSDESINLGLKTRDTSDSQLKLFNIYRDYPVPEDPGLVPAFWVLYPPPIYYKDDGIKKFEDLVKEMGLVPPNLIKEMLRTDTLNLRHWGVDAKIFQALCKAIPNNTTVQNIDLRDTLLTPNCCCHLASLLTKNSVISRVDLSGCKIGVEGAEQLQDGISAASALTDLDIRRCDLGDDGLQYIASGISCSPTLEDVNLSDNHLGHDSARSLNSIFLQAEVLKRLDLSWNFLYNKECAIDLFRGLTRNETIQYLNMSWNGLDQDCAPPLCSYLVNNQTLREINLSDNRFNAIAGAQIAKALSKNTGLEVLRLGNNPLEPAGALALVKALLPEKSPGLQLRTLDLTNVWAEKNILQFLEKLDNDRPQLDIILGGILGNYKLQGPDSPKIFLKRANFETMSPKKKKQRKNFGHFVISLKDEIVPKATFKESIKKGKFMLTDAIVDELMNCFAISKGRVDQAALKRYYLKEYPDTQPPPPNTPKSARKKTKAA